MWLDISYLLNKKVYLWQTKTYHRTRLIYKISIMTFQEEIRAGIPTVLPEATPYAPAINHTPKRKVICTRAEN